MSATIDDALILLHRHGWEYGPLGLANHGPMAAEALFALGRAEAVLPWVERYCRRLGPLPGRDEPIAEEVWPAALGAGRRVGDWNAFFERALAEQPWATVLDTWVARLAPGIAAAAFHGAIRTGHAVRSLSAVDTAPRRSELAQGLAYWAANYQLLPGAPSASPDRRLPSEALGAVPLLPVDQRRRGGLIVGQLERVARFAAFAPVIDRVDPRPAPPAFLADLTETLARVYVANADGRNFFALLHAVTGPSALRPMLPHLSADSAQLALRHAWQACAALYAGFAYRPETGEIEPVEEDDDDLIDRSLAVRDEHAIKLTEVCLREDGARPSPAYRAAARDAVARLGGVRQRVSSFVGRELLPRLAGRPIARSIGQRLRKPPKAARSEP